MLEGRLKLLATKCQLLVGSWSEKDGSRPGHLCPCDGPKSCPLTVQQLEELRHADEVHEACKKNQQAYHAYVAANPPEGV